MDFRTLFVIILLIGNLIFAPILVKYLGKKGFYKKKEAVPKKGNRAYYSHLLENMDTPSSFGVLFLINLVVLFSIFRDLEFITIASASLILGALGLYDDIFQFFFHRVGHHWGLKARYKLLIQTTVFFIAFYIITNSVITSVVSSFVASFILNSYNITDGLDGLVGGISIPILGLFAYMEYSMSGMSSIFYLTVMTLLFILVFMIFNIKPAKVFLGDCGAYAIGGLLAFLALRYPLGYSLPLLALIVIEGLSSFFQIFSVTVFKRKVLTIAPLHLHLLNIGWSQWKVIGGAWILQIIITLVILFTYAK